MRNLVLIIVGCLFIFTSYAKERPNIILIMTDDQGWGETGYYNHPVLKTPNLDKMAKNGLRFDRFYAGAPVCSPTRASVLTGRECIRSGVPTHGKALRKQEKVLPFALKDAGYITGHFGKWHLNGVRGPGVPIFKEDTHSPGEFGFDTWLSVTNFFDINPIMSRNGEFEEFKGTSSDIIVSEALKFIEKSVDDKQPFFAVIWDGSPHNPFVSTDEDMKSLLGLDTKSQNHYGELVAFDRSIGTLRNRIKELNIAKNTIIWYCSDNGGLPEVEPETVGGLRGFKHDVYEGGIRVPGIVEWEGHIKPGITNVPATTMDIFPTILDILGMSDSYMLEPIDGMSIKPLLEKQKMESRSMPIPFIFFKKGALVDNDFKIVTTDIDQGNYELYNIVSDKTESKDISAEYPEEFEKMKAEYLKWLESIENSVAGKDYPEGVVKDENPESRFWIDDERYENFKKEYGNRPEYSGEYRKMNTKKE